MAERSINHRGLVVPEGQPLIGVPLDADGRGAVEYFTGEEEADRALPFATEEALRLAGAWEDLDWQDMEESLHLLRRESEPSPPITSSLRPPLWKLASLTTSS